MKHIDWYHKDVDGKKTYRRLCKPRVVNHPVFDPHRAECEEDYYYGLVLLFVPFTDEADLLLPGETAKQAFERLKIDGLQTHHGRLQKMLSASKKRKGITEARKADDEEDGLLRGKSPFEEPLNLYEGVDTLDSDRRVSMLNGNQRRVYETFAGHLLHELSHDKGDCTCSALKPLREWSGWNG